jgi:hypothetical protein
VEVEGVERHVTFVSSVRPSLDLEREKGMEPNLENEVEMRDVKVLVLESTDGDGKIEDGAELVEALEPRRVFI